VADPGCGYYLASWVVENQMKVTLWLYGEEYWDCPDGDL
jgi:hypothetical protein